MGMRTIERKIDYEKHLQCKSRKIEKTINRPRMYQKIWLFFKESNRHCINMTPSGTD